MLFDNEIERLLPGVLDGYTYEQRE